MCKCCDCKCEEKNNVDNEYDNEDQMVDVIICDRDTIEDYCIDKFSTEENVTVYCDYKLACKLQRAVCDIYFDETRIDLSVDSDEYVCTITTYYRLGNTEQKALYINKARAEKGNFKGKILGHEEYGVCIIALNNISEIFDSLYAEEITVLLNRDVFVKI